MSLDEYLDEQAAKDDVQNIAGKTLLLTSGAFYVNEFLNYTADWGTLLQASAGYLAVEGIVRRKPFHLITGGLISVSNIMSQLFGGEVDLEYITPFLSFTIGGAALKIAVEVLTSDRSAHRDTQAFYPNQILYHEIELMYSNEIRANDAYEFLFTKFKLAAHDEVKSELTVVEKPHRFDLPKPGYFVRAQIFGTMKGLEPVNAILETYLEANPYHFDYNLNQNIMPRRAQLQTSSK